MKISRNQLKEMIREIIDELVEARKKKVIRKGKLIKKTFCPPGQKAKGGRCVPMSFWNEVEEH